MPINSIQGIHENLEPVFDGMPTDTFGNFKNILARLKKVPTQIYQVISLLRHGVKRGILSHRVSVVIIDYYIHTDGSKDSFTFESQ